MNVNAQPEPAKGVRHVRAMFLSDFHLGTRGCQAEMLLDFLKHYDADTIYLVGDIVDGWRMKRGWYWPQTHNDVVQKLMRKARHGTRIVYIAGNHDEFLRDFIGTNLGNIEIQDNAVHLTATGQRLYVMHGDQLDMVMAHAKWLAYLGDWAYETALVLNGYVNYARRKLGLTYWSLSAWAKLKVKKAVNFIGQYEQLLCVEARKHSADGIVCGHIHHAADHVIDGIRYLNCGDWVESCTGIVEHHDGQIELIRWTERLPVNVPQENVPFGLTATA